MTLSIEIPVIRAGWLIQCIDSVLQQTSPNWVLSLYWDCGDAASKQLLEELDRQHHPRIHVYFGTQSLGIARARQFLTERSGGEYILPLDDDDVLHPDAVKLLLQAAIEKPWASIIRARRNFIDDKGEPILMTDWFAFERRKYINGATCDVTNHSHPYAINRAAYMSKGGWSGFSDFKFVGEDCTCFTKSEEVGEIELVDEVLYYYRIHQKRSSLDYTPPDAYEMWRRIADESVIRRKAPVKRMNEIPPFIYETHFTRPAGLDAIGIIIPFWETNEREIDYRSSRPIANSSQLALKPNTVFRQSLPQFNGNVSRVEVAFSSTEPVEGTLSVAFFQGSGFSPFKILSTAIYSARPVEFEIVSLRCGNTPMEITAATDIEISFKPKFGWESSEILLHLTKENGHPEALMRFFESHPNHCRKRLDKGLLSLSQAGITEDQIHVIEEPQSSAANRNKGFRICDKEWICLMDDDVQILGPETLTTLLDCMVEYNAGLCGPKLLTPGGRIYSGAPFTNPLIQSARVAGMGELDFGQYDYNAIVPWLPSTLMMIHQSVALSTGGFDESFIGSQHEDADFCLRARARGFNCCYAGKTAAIHDNKLRNASFSANMHYLKERWKDRPDLFVWPAAELRS